MYKKRKALKANNLYCGILNQPLKSMFTMSNGIVNEYQFDDILLACNGHPFRGAFRFLKDMTPNGVPKKSDRF